MSEYIVNGAVLSCDMGRYPTKLTVPVSRMRIAGKMAAHSQDCVPAVNIADFGTCASGTYLRSKKARAGDSHPCILDLMDHYYLVDENMTLSDSFEIMNPLDNCINRIRTIISGCVSDITSIQHISAKNMNYQISDSISKQYSVLWKKTNDLFLFKYGYCCCETAE